MQSEIIGFFEITMDKRVCQEESLAKTWAVVKDCAGWPGKCRGGNGHGLPLPHVHPLFNQPDCPLAEKKVLC
jgi:hypothetical protein